MVQRISAILVLLLTLTSLSWVQISEIAGETSPKDPLLQRIGKLSLTDETVFEGLSKLNGLTGLGFAVEHELTSRESPALAPVIRFKSAIENVTVRDALDWLCTLDPRYTWSTDGHIVNFYPKSVENDSNYPLNMMVGSFEIQGVSSATAAVGAVTRHTSPAQQLAILQLGSDEFKVPKTLSFDEMTLRQALNVIAEKIGPSYAWQFTGTKDFHCMVFHQRLLPSTTVPRPETTTPNSR